MMNLKARVDKLEAQMSPEVTEMDMLLWQMHLEDHPDDDPLPPAHLRGISFERLLRECINED
jgi:hypothetical protein